MVYQLLRQDPNGVFPVYVRTAGMNEAVSASIDPAIAWVDPSLLVPSVQTMNESLSWVMAMPRFRAALLILFAVFGLLLAAVGIYGVVTQRVSQRMHELGIRVALGARHEDIWMLVIDEGLKLAVAGIAIGVVGALVLTRFLSSMLYGIKSTNALIFVTVSVLLASVALLACFLPARRAAGVDPMRVLRME